MISKLDERDIDFIADRLSMISSGYVLKDCNNKEHIGELGLIADQVMARINSRLQKEG